MNKYIKVKPILFSCILLGIAFFLIYAATTTNTAVDVKSPGDTILSAGQGSGTQQASMEQKQPASMEQKQQAFSIMENDSLYDTSRGDFFRDTYHNPEKQSDQAESKQEDSIIADLAVPTEAEPAAEVVKSADPASEAVKPAVQAEPVKPAEPAKPAQPAAAATGPAPQKEVIAEAKPEPAAAEAAPNNASDLDLLARLITAEAQGEPYEAQVAVGAVVMNRVKSGDWADTIRGVIYQNIGGYYQFTPVENGWIDKPALPEGIEAAKEAMNGADPTNGSQFYYDDKVTNTWILAKPVSVQFGHMIFAY